jgi:predicted nucleotidyltransferase
VDPICPLLVRKIPKNFIFVPMRLDESKIASIKAYFKTRPVLKAYLFGSYARGQADLQSDIDILVD